MPSVVFMCFFLFHVLSRRLARGLSPRLFYVLSRRLAERLVRPLARKGF